MRDRKPATAVTPEYLERAALDYLKRFETTESRLTGVLKRRVIKRCMQTGQDPGDFDEVIEKIVSKCSEKSFVDDSRFTERFIERSAVRGLSKRGVLSKLHAKGISPSLAEKHLGEVEYDEDEAARAFAQRKRIGIFRTAGTNDPDQKKKDMSKLARQGFSFEICSKLVDWR